MTKKSTLLLSLLMVTAVLATPDLPNLNINHEDCDCNNAHQLRLAAEADKARLQKLTDDVLPHSNHYAGRIKELIQLSCSPQKGSVLLQVPSKSLSASQKAQNLHADLQDLPAGDSEPVQFLHSNLKEAALNLVQLHDGTVERENACHSAQDKIDLHSSFIQKVEDGHKEVDNRLHHIDTLLKECTIALQMTPNTIRDRDALATDGTLSNEIKKRLNMLTDRDDGDNTENVVAQPEEYYSHGNLDDLNNAYKSQIAKAAIVKLALGNLGNQIAQLQDGMNNANDDGLKNSYHSKIVLHQRIQTILQDQYACEIAKAILIQICIKIKIDITVVIDILITYGNNAQNLTPGSQAYLQNLAQQYPYQLQLAGLYRRNLAAEKRYQLQNNRGANLINQLIPIYNQLQNLGVNTAPQLTTCQNQLNSLQGSNNYLQGYIPQLNQLYQNQIGKLIPHYLRLTNAGMQPGQNLQNQISQYLINAPNFAPHQLYPTAKALKNRLNQQMNVLSQCQNFLTSAGAPIPGQYLAQPVQYQLTPQIQALQNQYNAEAQVVPTLNLLIQIQLRIEFLFGQLQSGQAGQPSNLSYLEGEAAPQQPISPEQQAYNTQLSICGLLQLKLELLCQLLANLQNCQNNLNQGQNALQGQPQHKLAFQFGQNYAPQLASEVNNLPGEISTCQNMLNNLQNQLQRNRLGGNVPHALILNRLQNYNNLISNLENQVASNRRPLVIQHIGQQLTALQQGQPIQYNLISALNNLEAPQAAQQQCVEYQIQGLVQARAPHANLYQNYLQSQCAQAAALRPRLEHYILQAARLNRLVPKASPSQLAQLQPQIQYYNLMGNALQNQFNIAKQIAVCFQIIIQLEGKIYQLLGQPSNLGQAQPSNLEALPSTEAGANVGYPQQLQICVLIKLCIQYQVSLCSALGQAPAAQLQVIHALQRVPSSLVQEAQNAPHAILQSQNLAKNYRLQFSNQIPVANIWSNRYQNALARLQRLAPSHLNVPNQISQLVPQNMIPQQGQSYVVNKIVQLIPQEYNANQLYPMHLKLCILIKFALENQLQQAANLQHQLQQANLAPQTREHLQNQLSQCQNQANALQGQYQPQRALVTHLKFYNLVNNQIQNLRNQVGNLQAPYVNNLASVPEAVNQQIYPLQLQLCALYKIQLQICIKLASVCQNANNQYPSSSLIPHNLAHWLSEAQLPSAPQETQCFLNMIAIIKILFGQQQPVASNLAMQLRKIPNVNQLRGQYMPYYNQLMPQLGNQAETQCANELQNQIASMIPSHLQANALYPQHLSLCLQVKLQLESCIQQAAQLQNQLQQANLAPQVRHNLQNQFNQLQGQAVPLQQQYANQYEICILLKFLTLCQSHLQNLNNQVNNLISQYPNAQGLHYLENAEGANIPTSIKQQICQLQIQIMACIRLQFQICVPLANAVAQANNEAPSANLLPYNLRNRLAQVQLPSAGQEYPIIIQFIILLKFQLTPQQALTNNLASRLSQALTPSQVESQCNNYLQGLRPQLRGQAETMCNNELQNQLASNIPSSLTPEQLYPLHLQICIQIRLQLENLIPQAAQLRHQLQGNNLSPQQRSHLENQLSQCQNQISALQGQLGPQNAILITLKFIILLEGQIQNLNNQISPLMNQYNPSQLEGSVPENVQNQICQLQIQLLACIKLKYQLCIQFANQASQCNNTTPEQLTPYYLQGVPRSSLLPTPGQEQQIALQYIVMNKLRHQLQQNVARLIGRQLPHALTPSQIESQCNNYLSNLRSNLANLAETSCANEIKQYLAGQVPSQLVPEQAYPLHLSLCLQIKLQLEHALQNAANIQNQLQVSTLTPQQRANLQQQLVPWQNIANQLQPQYSSQKQICMLLKFIILIEGQISACNNQISSLVPNYQPGYLIGQRPSHLQGANPGQAYLTPGESVPTSVQPQVYQIQLQLLACIRLKYQICSSLANALQGANNAVPQQRLAFPFLNKANLLPTAQNEYQSFIPLLTVCKQQQQQQQNLVYSLAQQLPQGYSPAQVESQCNNYLSNMRLHLANQAETQCNNEMQNMLAQNIPSHLAPEQLYPLHLSLCLQVKLALEQALQNAANIQYQLQQANLKPQLRQALQSRLAHFKTLANQLQPQYNSQKQICVLLKFLIICEGQIQNLNNQIGNLMAPYSHLGQNQGPNYLSYMTAQPNIPQNIQIQICQLQIQLLACIKIKFQICIQVCQVITTCNNIPPGQIPTENVGIIPTENQFPTVTTTEGAVPTGQIPTTTTTEAGSIPTTEGAIPYTYIPSGQIPTTTATEGAVPTVEVPTTSESASGQAPGPGAESSVPNAESAQQTYVPTLPTPSQEYNYCVILCVCIKLKFELQLSLCNNLGSQLPQALSPSQIRSQAQNYITTLRPQLANQAETQCANEMQNNLARRVPSSLVPENLYPQHLSLCLQIQINLQYLIQQAAPLQNQLQQNNLSPQQRLHLQSLLTPIQRQINQLQPQYTNQKAICVYLKFILLCEGQIQNLNNQIANLLPQGQNYLNIPSHLQNQLFPLQLQLLACMKLKFSICGQLSQALSQCNNTVPSNLIPSGFIPSHLQGGQMPSPSQELSACQNFASICGLKLEQQQNLVYNLGGLLPKALTPSQIRPQVNQYLVALRSRLANQAETQCANEMQNNLARNIPSSLLPAALYPQQLSLCLQNKLALEYALQRAAHLQNQLQQANLAPAHAQALQNELTECQNLANQLQPVYANQKQFCILLKFCIIIEGQINNLNNQVNNLMAPYNNNYLEAIPQSVQNQAFPLQLQLLACIKIKFQICIQLYSQCSNVSGQVPTSSIIPSNLIPANLRVGQVPQPNQLQQAYLHFLVINKLKHNLQRNLVNALGGQLPKALSPSEVETQCNNAISGLRPQLAAQAETQCANELQNRLAQNIPSGMAPQHLYPLHLSLCAQVLNNLQHQLVRAANLAHQLQQPNLALHQQQALQNELTICQNQAAQLQQQYENQKQICIYLKFIIICEVQINNLNNQIGQLVNQYRPSGLQGPNHGFNLANMPQSAQQQMCNLQLQLLACIKIKFQICIQICQYVSTCNNTIPSGPGTIPTYVPSSTEYVPTGQGSTESIGTVPTTTEYVPTGQGSTENIGAVPTTSTIPVGEAISTTEGAPAGQAAPTVSETASLPTVEGGAPTETGFPSTTYGGPGDYPGGGPGFGTLPTPGNEFNWCIQICVCIKIKLELQLSLCNNLAQQYPQALAANQLQPRLNQLVNQLRPQMLGQAQTACVNNLQSHLQQRIPRNLAPSQLYPRALRNAANLRYKLENALANLAQGAQPLYGANKPQSYLFQQLAPQLAQAQQLQQEYETQKNICIALKFILIIQGQLPGLLGQVNQLIGQGPNFRLYPHNLESVPANVRSQCAELQNQIAPRLRLQYQNFNNLAQALAPYSLNNLQGGNYSPEFSTCVIYICILSLQQPGQLQLVHALQPSLSPQQVETNCNNAAEQLRPTLYNQAQNLVVPAIQQLVPRSNLANNALRALQLRLALQLSLCNNIQNQLAQAQNAAKALVGTPQQHNYMLSLCNELQNRLNAENNIARNLYYLIPIQQNINQIGSQLVPGQQNALIYNLAPSRANLANQAKLAFLTNLQHLVNVKLANEQQNAIQALTNCVNALGNLQNNAPSGLARNVYALQRQSAANALTECQNNYQNQANVQIPQALSAVQQQQNLLNNLQTACQNAGVQNPSALVGQAQQECKAAISITIDITAIIETNVNTVTNVRTQGEPGNGEAQVETNVHQNVGTSSQTVGGSSFLSMRKL